MTASGSSPAWGVEDDARQGVTVKHRTRVRKDPTQPNLRQVHLIHAELLAELKDAGFSIAVGDLGENITTSGLDLLGLTKKNGAWHGLLDGKPTSGVTIADLARDGMLTLSTDGRVVSARLTEQGHWFARTLLYDTDVDMPR
jgi:hypothetical protein